MDTLRATHAIWHDPLSYDYLKDGPPYLPSMEGGKVASMQGMLRQAHTEVGSDVGTAFQHCVAEYGGAPMAELAVLLACLRAEAQIHQAHHWQTRGPTYYGDHQLFMRVYEEVDGLADGLAERAVGLGAEILVQPLLQVSQMAVFSKLFYGDAPVQPTVEELPLLSLRALLKSSLLLQFVYSALESQKTLSLGLDNLLQGIADKQESLAYLLRQRTSTKVAGSDDAPLGAFKHGLLIRRVASRFVEELNDLEAPLSRYAGGLK